MEIRLDGKVAVVTGGSRGIGEAVALVLAGAGASVMLVSRRADGLARAAAAIDAAKGDRAGVVAWTVANAGDPAQAETCVAEVIERFGSMDILVNNAATMPYFGPLSGIEPGQADKMMRVNATGYLEWTTAAWRQHMSERGGVVLNMASIGGLSVNANLGWYNVTKAAVINLTCQLAREFGPGVRVNALAPGLVKTEFTRSAWEEEERAIAGQLPLGRLGEVEDIARAALFLCSDWSSWITGATLVIDGGALCTARGGLD